MGAQGPEQQKKVTYCTYLASGGQSMYWACSRLNNMQLYYKFAAVLQIFAIFQLCHAHVRKDTKLSPLFRAEFMKATESWVGAGCC